MSKQNRFQRKQNPAPIRFQKRDGEVLKTIYRCDGVLARRQVKQLFWPSASPQAMRHRLSLLYHKGFLNMPDRDQRRTNPIPEPIVWLGWRGILLVARQERIEVDAPNKVNENQLRKLEKQLRTHGIRWQREPRWSQLEHDIAVNDFRLTVEHAAHYWPSISLKQWIPEGEFFVDMDTIRIGKRKKGIHPDGFFILVDHLRLINNTPAKARFLLEFDNGTHPITRFGRDKAKPGLAYIRSKAYRERFGYNSGRWLVVCKSERRMENLKSHTEKILGNQSCNFFFTTLEKAEPLTVFNQAIWLRGGSKKFIPLVDNIGVTH